ncbi:glycoside hydrolase family 16 protein [Phanerochaete carnosa HHB-10118-sp]|uniref:Glycoside hydrolase family 16 protein n=1 Tax=Phanerochaete carnosa (strain HHB-10118-sp) TaxID=650164 RepID=K5UJM0_PHACS|nr:glycoside hydrolase family 16 protein [Phanerochaete carnosa HHB-10118-sp]EKM49761.1 glycoside hydrolase family 16 protein [Phanerochaete carnosa HHB-10118-sp]
MRLLAVLGSLLLPVLANAQYQMVKEYIGDSFFDDWAFYNNNDNLTNGNAFFVSAKEASQDKLAFVNDAGNAIMKVDNTSNLNFNDNRNTIRITSTDRFTVGSLWIADMLHVPYGCSVWPAWWSSAPNWPAGGEIDTLEGVNQVTMSHMALHTAPGCVQSNTSVETSTLVNTTDCSTLANNNEGCTVTTPGASYGPAFAAAGGGVFVTEFASKGISIWFFNRTSLPQSLQGNASTVDTSTLGTPTGNWPSDGCNINSFFEPQQLVFDITLCGDFAGTASIFQQTCTGICYDDWVLGSPSNYDTAYFEVQYVRVYGQPGELTVIPSGGVRSAGTAAVFTVLVAVVAAVTLAW